MLQPSLLFFNLNLLGINSFGAVFSILILLFFSFPSRFLLSIYTNIKPLFPAAPHLLLPAPLFSADLVIKLSFNVHTHARPAFLAPLAAVAFCSTPLCYLWCLAHCATRLSCCCDKMPERKDFEWGKIYFGSCFQRLWPVVNSFPGGRWGISPPLCIYFAYTLHVVLWMSSRAFVFTSDERDGVVFCSNRDPCLGHLKNKCLFLILLSIFLQTTKSYHRSISILSNITFVGWGLIRNHEKIYLPVTNLVPVFFWPQTLKSLTWTPDTKFCLISQSTKWKILGWMVSQALSILNLKKEMHDGTEVS